MNFIDIFVLVCLGVLFVFIIFMFVIMLRQDIKNRKRQQEFYCSVDDAKKNRIDRLRRDLEECNIPKEESLKIAIKLEDEGWRKVVDFNCLEI